MKRISAWGLLRTAAPRRALLTGTLLAMAAELSGAALLGVSGWFLTTCAVITLQANTTWSWMYPSGAVRALALTRTGLRYLERLVNHQSLLAAQVALRARLARGAAGLTPRELRAQRDGTLLTRLTTDVETVAGLPANAIAPLVAAITTACLVEGLLLWTMPVLGAVELIVWAVGLTCIRHAHHRARSHLADAAEARAALRTALLGSRAAFNELRCLDALPQAQHSAASAMADVESAEWATARAERHGRLTLRLHSALGQATVLVIALRTAPAQPIAVVVGEVLLVATGWELLERLPRLMQHLSQARDATGRLASLAAEAHPAGRRRAALHSIDTAGLPLIGSPVGLTMTVARPGLVLVTGPNGSGKSTLLGQLAGRVPAPAGTVLLDGTPLHDLAAQTVAETVTLVEADDWLADDTIAANLRHAAPSADTTTLWAALAVVALSALPLDTPVGPGGRLLSQGQRRRLATARAVLRRPAVLLLDEPVAGLDRPTAQALLAALPQALPGTALVISLQEQDLALLDMTPTTVVRLGTAEQPHTGGQTAEHVRG
jgi:ATP-binding cassette subfamily C protein CydC